MPADGDAPRVDATAPSGSIFQEIAPGSALADIEAEAGELVVVVSAWLSRVDEAFDDLGIAGGGGFGGGGRGGMRKNKDNTLYKRGQILFADNASDVDLVKEKDNIVELKLFSDEYFALIKDNSVTENQLLASQKSGEELIVRLRGKIYRIK